MNRRLFHKCVWYGLFAGLILGHCPEVFAQGGGWSQPVIISALPGFSWFPDLAIDVFGTVHIVWCQTIPLEEGGLQEGVSYVSGDGETWTEPNDVVSPSADIVRNGIAADRSGKVYLIYGGSVYDRLFALYYTAAPAGEAWSAGAWEEPHLLNQGSTYMGDIAIDSDGVIHVVYDDIVSYTSEEDQALADIYYRRSADGGRTWSAPINLGYGPELGSARSSIKIDSSDVIHVTWDEGWDRLRGGGSPRHSVYTFSQDGGRNWTPPTVVEYPGSVAQLTASSDGSGGVMLVWRSSTRNELYYMWSTDGGFSWGPPLTIPDVYARPWSTPFDRYDMAVDGDGQIHLIVVGQDLPQDRLLLGVYHLTWDGIEWSDPDRIFVAEGLYPEYPRIRIHEGNQLHAVWFTREGNIWDDFANREIWYTSGLSSASHKPIAPLTVVVPTSSISVPTPFPEVTSVPTEVPVVDYGGLPGGLYTESDEVLSLSMALAPILLVVLILIGLRLGWFGRFRR